MRLISQQMTKTFRTGADVNLIVLSYQMGIDSASCINIKGQASMKFCKQLACFDRKPKFRKGDRNNAAILAKETIFRLWHQPVGEED